MELLFSTLAVWGFAFAVYHLNPLNDMSRLDSPCNYYSPESVQIREAVAEAKDSNDIVIEWPVVRPYIYASICAMGYLVMETIK